MVRFWWGPTFWFAGSCRLIVFSCGREQRELSGVPSIRALFPFMRATPSWFNFLLNSHLLIWSYWELGFQHMNWGRVAANMTNIQFITTTPFQLLLPSTIFLLNISQVYVLFFTHCHCCYFRSGQSFLACVSQGLHNWLLATMLSVIFLSVIIKSPSPPQRGQK